MRTSTINREQEDSTSERDQIQLLPYHGMLRYRVGLGGVCEYQSVKVHLGKDQRACPHTDRVHVYVELGVPYYSSHTMQYDSCDIRPLE